MTGTTRLESDDAETIARAMGADAGVLLIHGAGVHPPKETLYRILEPTLHRLADERQLVAVTPFTFGDPTQVGGQHDALLVEYTLNPTAEHTAQSRWEPVKKFVAVEGRWYDAYDTPGKKAVSIWFGRHSFSTCMGMLRYHVAQPWPRLLASILLIALLLASLFSDIGGTFALGGWWQFGLLFAAAVVALITGALTSWLDVIRPPSSRNPDFKPGTRPGDTLVFLVTTASFYGLYQVQRALMIVASLIAIFALPVVAAMTRILSSIPIIAGLSPNVVASAETAFMSGSPASLQAIADSQIASGAIQRRMRDALFTMQSLLKDGATVTVLGYSTGGPVAWHLLSEPHAGARGIAPQDQPKGLRYRLLTVGAQLNWARRGYDSKASRLDRPLINTVAAAMMETTPEARSPLANLKEPTLWANLYGTMDPSPQGPVRPGEFEGWARDDDEGERPPWWTAWDDNHDSPNRALNNLGSPLSGEHGEYFHNQQEFVPTLARAIDDEISWAAKDADKGSSRRDLLSNLRIGIVAPLTRFRAIFFGLAFFALWWLLHGRNLMTVPAPVTSGVCPESDDGIWDNRWLQCKLVELRGFSEDRWFEGILDSVFDNQWLLNTIILILFWLLIYAIVDGYTNFLWASVGRAPRSWLDRRYLIPGMTFSVVWVPTILAPAALLIFRDDYDLFGLYRDPFWWTLWTVFIVNTVVSLAEIAFVRDCVRAADHDGPSVYRQTGRTPTQERHQHFKQGPASGRQPFAAGD